MTLGRESGTGFISSDGFYPSAVCLEMRVKSFWGESPFVYVTAQTLRVWNDRERIQVTAPHSGPILTDLGGNLCPSGPESRCAVDSRFRALSRHTVGLASVDRSNIKHVGPSSLFVILILMVT